MLQFTLGGVDYEFDQDKLPLAEAIAVKKAAGISVREFLAGVSTGDPVALKALVWTARLRAGESVPFESIDFDVLDFFESVRHVNEGTPDSDAEREVDGAVPTMLESPTGDSSTGTTPADDEPAISGRSPSTSD